MHARSVLLALALTLGTAAAAAQGSAPVRPLFRAPLADPKEPQFFATYLWERSPRLAPQLGAVGFGQTIGLLRVEHWQLAIAAGVFSQFDMSSRTADLMNTDYLVGLPVTYQRGAVTTRFRLYHQSSHLGDEYMAHTQAHRVDLTFEAAELLVSGDVGAWRLYGGGEYVLAHSPRDLKPAVLHGGVEFRPPAAVARFGRFATGRFVAALDGKSFQDRGWQPGWSVVSGLEIADPQAVPGSGWRWSLLLKAYTGPAPYGEFYRDRVASLGLGVGFAP